MPEKNRHSSEIRGLCSAFKFSWETLQNLSYFMCKESHFLCFLLYNFEFFLYDSYRIEWKMKKKVYGFSYAWNIATFEAFHWNILLNANLLFMKSEETCLIKIVPVHPFYVLRSWIFKRSASSIRSNVTLHSIIFLFP